MFEMVAVGAMAMTLELRMPCLAIFLRMGVQSSLPPRGTSTTAPPFFLEKVERVLRKETAIPLGAFVAPVGAALSCQVARRFDGVVGDGFHGFVVEFDGFLGSERNVTNVERVLQPHDAESDRTVGLVGSLGRFGRVEVDVDHIVEGPDSGVDRLLELLVVDVAILIQVLIEDNTTKITHGRFVIARVERDLGTKVGRVDHADVILRRADVARILKSDPWVAGLENHAEHELPHFDSGNGLGPHFTLEGFSFVGGVLLFEVLPVGVVKIGSFAGAEEAPLTALFHALHEQVGNPVGCVHVRQRRRSSPVFLRSSRKS